MKTQQRGCAAFLSFCFLVIPFISSGPNAAAQEAAASVNGELITRQGLMDRLMTEFGKGLLEDMIDELIVLQEARRLKIEVTEEEVDSKVTEQRATHRSPEQFEAWLSERKLTLPAFRERMRTFVRLEKIVAPGIKIADENIAFAYIKNPEIYNEPNKIRIRGIMLPNRSQGEEVRRMALAMPSRFEQLVQQFSRDVESQKQGGDLGSFPLEDMEKMGLGPEKGKISEVIATNNGYWVYQVTEFQAAKRKTLKEAEPLIRKYLFEQQLAKAVILKFKELKDKAKIERALTGEKE